MRLLYLKYSNLEIHDKRQTSIKQNILNTTYGEWSSGLGMNH